ncbi:MAG: S26 family signal peptidase [Alphaproteobacteria bacterium]|nr:S26 family signal peptidase [Alphaproteobacteria bacterium]
MSARGLQFARKTGRSRRRHIGLAVMVVLAAVWLGAASQVHVNASWSDVAWGYAAFPLFGEDPEMGDRVLFEPPAAVGSRVPYLKTVRGVPGMAVAVGPDGTVFLDGEPVGRAKSHALDGRALEAIAPGVIPSGHYYLFADHADSHDSRYAEIGLVPRGRILGRAVAMPDLPWLGLDGPLVGPEDAAGGETPETAR